VLGIGLPLVAIIFYLNVGESKEHSRIPQVQALRDLQQRRRNVRRNRLRQTSPKLAKRLQSNPNDAQGWTMLARSYSSMEKYGEAAGAYAKATELTPKDADLLGRVCFATAMAGGRSLEGKPMELINRALKVDPENAKALQLAGSAAFEAKDYKKAIDYWQAC
jgi:cytochrome c-type biogenesis protein CcmH